MSLAKVFSCEIACSFCKKAENCIKMPCQHCFCKACYYAFHVEKVNFLRRLLNRDPTILNGETSYIGCPYYCPDSSLTVLPDLLIELFKLFNDSENAKVIEFFRNFLTGIPSYYLNCTACCAYHCVTQESMKCPKTS